MHNGKIAFLNFKVIKKSANKNHTSNSDIPKSNPCGEDEERNRKSLLNAKSSLPDDLNLNLDTLLVGME